MKRLLKTKDTQADLNHFTSSELVECVTYTRSLSLAKLVPGYKTFFMPNSAEHEIFSANIYENANCWHFHIFFSREIFMFNYV